MLDGDRRSFLRLRRYQDRRCLDARWIVMCLRDDDWALSRQVVYASAMGTFMVGIIPVGDKGSGAHEGLVVFVVAPNARVEGFEGAPEAWSGYRYSSACGRGPSDT